MELNLFVLGVIQACSAKKKGYNPNGNNPIVFCCALFCFQVYEITIFPTMCHRLYSKDDELYNDVQPKMLGNFYSSFEQYPK